MEGREGGREETDLLGIAEAAEFLHDDAGLVAFLISGQQPPRRLEEEGGAEELKAGEEGGDGKEDPPAALGGQGVGQQV